MIIPTEKFARHLREPTAPAVSYNTDYEQLQNNPDYEVQPPEPKQTPKIPISSEEISDKIVAGFDLLLNFGYEWYARQAVFETKYEYTQAKLLYKRIQASTEAEIEVSNEEMQLYEKYSVYLELLKEKKLENKEKQQLKEPLKKWLGELDIEMHPGWHLLIAVVGILATRFLQIQAAKKSLKQSEQ